MRIDIDQITGGKIRGGIIYVCDFRKPDLSQKAIRHVKPTKVVVYTEAEYTAAGKAMPRVNYSYSVLIPLNKNDEPVWSKLIKVYDNTGYRSYPGIPLEAFSTMEECIEYYNAQVQEVVDRYSGLILNEPLRLISEQAEIKSYFIK